MNQFRPSNFQVLPLVIKNLLIINVLVFLAQQTIGASGAINFDNLFALHNIQSPRFQPWQIITHLFMHANVMHIFGNMFALWMFGSQLESLWGPKRFLTFYFLCGIGAALIQLIFLWYDSRPLLNEFLAVKMHPTPEGMLAFYHHYGLDEDAKSVSLLQNYLNNPADTNSASQLVGYISGITNSIIGSATMGASGAIFGILAAFVYLFPNTYLYLYFLLPVKTKWIGLVYFASEIYSGIKNSSGDNIAHWAHIGGGLVGFLLVLTWNRQNRSEFY